MECGPRARRRGEARGLPRGAEEPPGGRPPLEAARHAAHRRPRRARPRGVPPPGARPGGRPRPLQGARVPGPRARVRAGGDGGGGRAPAARAARGDRGRRGRGPQGGPRRARRRGDERLRRCGRRPSGSPSRGRPAAPPTSPSPTRRSTCRRPPAARRRSRPSARSSRTRRSARPRAHAKRDRVVLERLGVRVAGLAFDALIASYLLDPGRRAYALEDLAMEHLGERRAAGTDGVAAADAAAIPTGQAAGSEAELVLRLDQADERAARAPRGSSRSTSRWRCRSSRCSPTSSGPG